MKYLLGASQKVSIILKCKNRQKIVPKCRHERKKLSTTDLYVYVENNQRMWATGMK